MSSFIAPQATTVAAFRVAGIAVRTTNAAEAELIVLYAQTDAGRGAPGIACFLVEATRAGFVRDLGPRGERFNPNKVLFDPYAREVTHNIYTDKLVPFGVDDGSSRKLLAPPPQPTKSWRALVRVLSSRAAEGEDAPSHP